METLIAGTPVRIKTVVRDHSTGEYLPREGKFMFAIETLNKTLCMIDFGQGRKEYCTPDEIELNH